MYTKYATPLDHIPLGDNPLVSFTMEDFPAIDTPEANRLYWLTKKSGVCGKPMDFFNPAVTDRPKGDYMRAE
jgi:hypothetical protein